MPKPDGKSADFVPNVEPSEVVNHAQQSSRITFANDEFRLIIPLNYDEGLSRHRRETLKGDFSQKPRQKRSGKLRRRGSRSQSDIDAQFPHQPRKEKGEELHATIFSCPSNLVLLPGRHVFYQL